MSQSDPVRVAVIGSGLTGLVAAYLLSSDPIQKHDDTQPATNRICVEIFERASTLGMDSASISVPLDTLTTTKTADSATDHLSRTSLDPVTGKSMLRIDVPMRAFTGGYYPQLLSLYKHLGIGIEKTNFTYSFATATKSESVPQPSILYNGSNGLRGVSLPSHLRSHIGATSPMRSLTSIAHHVVNAKRFLSDLLVLILGYLQLLIIALWHYHLGHTASLQHPIGAYTLRDLVKEPFPASKASRATWSASVLTFVVEAILRRVVVLDPRFVRATLVPLFSAVMTSSTESVWDSPASQVLDYVALTLGRDHFVVKDGVRQVVASLLVHFDTQNDKQTFDPTTSKGKVWTDAEVQSVQYADGKAWIEVIHHKQSSSSSPSTLGQESRSQTSPCSSSSSTLFDDADTVQQSSTHTSTVTQTHGGFDHLIFATQANQSANFLRQYRSSLDTASSQHSDAPERITASMKQVDAIIQSLEAFKYEKSLVINHTDQSLLPSSKSDWRDLNLVSPTVTSGPSPPCDTLKGRGGSQASKEVWTDLDSDTSSDESSNSEERALETDPTSPLSSSLSTLSTPLIAVDKSDWQARLSALYQKEPSRNSHSMATHILSQPSKAPLSKDARYPALLLLLLLQTTNPLPHLMPRADTILSQTYFERAVIDVPAHLARQRLFTASRNGKLQLGELHQRVSSRLPAVWTCGSWSTGIPLLEGCVVSASLVAQEIARLESLTLPTFPPTTP